MPARKAVGQSIFSFLTSDKCENFLEASIHRQDKGKHVQGAPMFLKTKKGGKKLTLQVLDVTNNMLIVSMREGHVKATDHSEKRIGMYTVDRELGKQKERCEMFCVTLFCL